MNKTETEFEQEIDDRKPRRTRKRSQEKSVVFYHLENDGAKKIGQFNESVIGNPLERRIPIFANEFFGKMFYGIAELRADIRKPNGAFEKTIPFSITSEPNKADDDRQRIVEVEPEEFDDEPEELSFVENNGQMNVSEVENLLLKERLKRFEDELSRQKTGNRSEMQTLIAALEESRREQRELMMMMLSQSQKPQQDATTQAMNILEKSLGIVTKAKAISEEIAPTETSSNGSFLGDATTFMDSLGRNAGQFIPMFLGNRMGGQTSGQNSKPSSGKRTSKPPAKANETQPGELTSLLNKVANKKESENK